MSNKTNINAENRKKPIPRARLEQEFPGDIYQQLIVYQRSRHNTTEGELWQGKSEYEPAASLYPNILAELDASGLWMDHIASNARVSMAIMASVMEDNGELSFHEMSGLARCFRCEIDYLAAPILSIVDPSTNKGKRSIQHLRDLLTQTEGMDRFFYNTFSPTVLPALESGKPVTYAAYRWACRNLQSTLDRKAREEERQRRTRTETTIQGPGIQQVLEHERDVDQESEACLSSMRKYVDGTKIKNVKRIKQMTCAEIFSLLNLSKQDLCGALVLSFTYGRASGYRAGKRAAAV